MSKWVFRGLRTGIKSTRYPQSQETAAGVSPGRPGSGENGGAGAVVRCPTGALVAKGQGVAIDHGRCVHCFRCTRDKEPPLAWAPGYEWAGAASNDAPALAAFARSLHIRVVDGGACGACLSEIEQANKPYYNMHRLGFFSTPTPRAADVLLVCGPLTANMRSPLRLAYEGMPEPKRVVAVGTCAVSGGIFGPSFACAAGVSEGVPVDVALPGCPPPPLAILHALLVVVGRRPAVPMQAGMASRAIPPGPAEAAEKRIPA